MNQSNRINFYVLIGGIILAIILIIYGIYLAKNRQKIPPVVLEATQKESFGKGCLSLVGIQNENNAPFVGSGSGAILCGAQSNDTFPVISSSKVVDYFKQNNNFALAFNLKTLLEKSLYDLRNNKPISFVLPESFPICVFIYPDLAFNETNEYRIYPQEVIKDISRTSTNFVVCTNYFTKDNPLNFVIVGEVIKEGTFWKQFANSPLDKIKIELNIPQDINKIPKEGISDYFLRNPLDFVPIYQLVIPIK